MSDTLYRKNIYPLGDKEAIIILPAKMDKFMLHDLQQYLAVLWKNLERQIDSCSSPIQLTTEDSKHGK